MTEWPKPCPTDTHKTWCCPYHDHRNGDPATCRCVPAEVKEPGYRLPRQWRHRD